MKLVFGVSFGCFQQVCPCWEYGKRVAHFFEKI
jgi:hypothetical protein